MLPDLQRKLLRIFFNFSGQHRRMPTWTELERKTGRKRQELWRAMEQLKESGYLDWEERSGRLKPQQENGVIMRIDLQDIRMLQSREPEPRRSEARSQVVGQDGEDRIKYWTQH
jgi:DNA-binding IclR family transcriptional regulator